MSARDCGDMHSSFRIWTSHNLDLIMRMFCNYADSFLFTLYGDIFRPPGLDVGKRHIPQMALIDSLVKKKLKNATTAHGPTCLFKCENSYSLQNLNCQNFGGSASTLDLCPLVLMR